MLHTASLFSVFCLVLSASAHPGHHEARSLPSETWYHRRDHEVYKLFRRGVGADGQTYPDVGTPTWAAKYPTGTPDSTKMPQEWQNALNAAVQAGKIPNIPVTTVDANSNPDYPAGTDPNSAEVCSTYVKCLNKNAIWDAPAGSIAIGFDDGPLPPSINLLNFLKANNQKATHFLIGIYMLQNVAPLQAVIASGDDIAAHTYTHPHMTSISNEDVVAQLGWSMQIIHDSTGGLVPKYWRPPYGDSDNRVLAIASEVFGLSTVIWNHDTEDWSLTDTPPGTTPQAINTSYHQWLTGPKSPGLIVLEHELSDESVNAFITAYPDIKANGWKTVSTVELVDANQQVYQNVVNGKVTPADILASSNSATSNAASNTTVSGSGTPSGSSTGAPKSSSPPSSASQSAPSGQPTNGAASIFGSIPGLLIAHIVLGLLVLI